MFVGLLDGLPVAGRGFDLADERARRPGPGQKETKLVLLDFTGSDWCSWCKKLDAEVFSKTEFSDYAKKNLVLVEVDFPAQKKLAAALVKANDALKDKYKITGYPTLIVLKPDGTVVWNQVGYMEGGPKAVIAKLDEAKKK